MKHIGIQISLHLLRMEARLALYPCSWSLYFSRGSEHITAEVGPLIVSFDWTNQGEVLGIVFHYFGKYG